MASFREASQSGAWSHGCNTHTFPTSNMQQLVESDGAGGMVRFPINAAGDILHTILMLLSLRAMPLIWMFKLLLMTKIMEIIQIMLQVAMKEKRRLAFYMEMNQTEADYCNELNNTA